MHSQLRKHVGAVERAMLDELRHWPWSVVEPLGTIVEGQLRAGGKRMRPLLALAYAETAGGDPARVVPAAASVELYHIASLVLDDVQDGARLRRGVTTVHASSSVSVAITVAALIRSLSYHTIHRCPDYDAEGRTALHRELDDAATRLVLGQGVDIGWNAGWYARPGDFPYDRMTAWKTGALFGCAAAMGALTAGSGRDGIDRARQFGVSFGMIYQMADDYLDLFGADGALGRPRFEDLRAGKFSAPVAGLLRVLAEQRDDATATSVVDSLRDPAADRKWLRSLMSEHAIADRLRGEIAEAAAILERPPGSALDDLVAAVLATVRPS